MLLLPLLFGAACGENVPLVDPTSPPAPEPAQAIHIAMLHCTGSVRGGGLSCRAEQPSLPGGANADLIIGGQGLYVTLASSNISVSADTFAFDATVQNLIPQTLGTADGVNPDARGVRVFFTSLATTAGTGTIRVANADGRDVFTAAEQPYFQYAPLLAHDQVSSARTWKLQFDPGVEQFSFKVYVSAAVKYPNGYIDLGESNLSLLEGGTRPLAPVVRTAVGVPIADQSVVWSSSAAEIAEVDSAGNLRALAPGFATLTASSGLRSAQFEVGVCPNLPVGGVYAAAAPVVAKLCFAGGASGTAEYTYMPLNLATAGASPLSLTVTGTGIQAVTGPPSPNRLPLDDAGLGSPEEMGETAALQHVAELSRARQALNPRLLSRQGAPARSGRSNGQTLARLTGQLPTVGQDWQINVGRGCTGTPDVRTGRVRSVSNRLIIVSDTLNPAGGFTTAQYDSIALEFDSIAFPVVSANFGAPTDHDGNGRIVAFFTRAVNELSPPASSVVETGYFASRDVFTADATGCAQSNEGEILYMLTPDPTGAVNSNVRTVSLVRGSVIRTMGHELQHLTNAWRRAYLTGASEFEQPWLDEGLSRIEEELMFYRTSVGLAPRSPIALTDLTTGPNASRRVAAFNTYANGSFGALRTWLQRPDTTGAFRTSTSSAASGVNWAFLRYAADRRGGSEAGLWSALVDGPASGIANLRNALGGAEPTEWLRDFTAAIYASNAVSGVAPAYQTLSWNYRSVFGGLGGFPLLPRPLTNNVPLTLSYAPGGGTSYVRFAVPKSGFATLTATSGPTPAAPYTVIVVRTK